jgi:hypothetical protein
MNDQKNPEVIWVRFRSGGVSRVEAEFLDKKKNFIRILKVMSVHRKGVKDPFDKKKILLAESQVCGYIYMIEKYVSVDLEVVKRMGVDPKGEKIYPIYYVEDIEKFYKNSKKTKKKFVLPSSSIDD